MIILTEFCDILRVIKFRTSDIKRHPKILHSRTQLILWNSITVRQSFILQ